MDPTHKMLKCQQDECLALISINSIDSCHFLTAKSWIIS